ncbi:MAG: alpha/beta hydrolase [Candidatus Krumholzibacteria bacterium]|nr:alpha/beta hydrolase [Candidatus Krumholzibacteria bacterium]
MVRSLNHRSLRVLFLILMLVAWATAAAAQEHSRSDLENAGPVEEGRGEFEIILIHGLGANASVWDEVVPFLKGTFKVQVFELAGHGATQPIADDSITAEVARLQEFIKEVDFAYPTLVGHGLGGMIAMQYALDHPADVHRLIVMDSAPMQLASQEQKAAVAEQLIGDYDQFIATRYLNMSLRESVTDKVVDMALRTDSTTFVSLLMSSFDFDLTDRLGQLSVPMLVVGSELMFPPADSSRHLLEHYGFNHARSLSFKRVARSGHYMMLEEPIMTASVLLAFGVTAEYTFEK